MLSIAPPPTSYLHFGSTDMRKSFDGLSSIIRGTFGSDPTDGSLFLFVNKRRTEIPELAWPKAPDCGMVEARRPVGLVEGNRYDTTATLVVKDSPAPSAPDNPKNARAREVIAAAQAEHRGSITVRMWVYRSVVSPINVFDFTVTPHRDGPIAWLPVGGLWECRGPHYRLPHVVMPCRSRDDAGST
jgi:hypothetical protein